MRGERQEEGERQLILMNMSHIHHENNVGKKDSRMKTVGGIMHLHDNIKEYLNTSAHRHTCAHRV